MRKFNKFKVVPEKDDNGRSIITKKYLKDLCESLDKYSTPELNDSLYLNCKGFKKMENLSEYFNLKSLYFDNNIFSKIENLEKLKELRCLFLQRNKIKKIEGLENLEKLHTLNLSHNEIRKIENLENLKSLENLNLGFNELKNKKNIELIIENKKITTFNIENNYLDFEENIIDDVFSKMENLKVLYLKKNPLIKKITNYRKTLISKIKKLTYLDTRPIKVEERRLAEIWFKKGKEGENKEKVKIQNEKQETYKRYINEIKNARKNAKNTKITDLMRYKDLILKDIDKIILKKNEIQQNLINDSILEKDFALEENQIEIEAQKFEIKKLDKEIEADELQMDIIDKKIDEYKNENEDENNKNTEGSFYRYEKVDKDCVFDKGDAIEEVFVEQKKMKENLVEEENLIKEENTEILNKEEDLIKEENTESLKKEEILIKEDNTESLKKEDIKEKKNIETLNTEDNLDIIDNMKNKQKQEIKENLEEEENKVKIVDIEKLLDFENDNEIFWSDKMVDFLKKELEKNIFDFEMTENNFNKEFNFEKRISEKDLRKKWTELMELESESEKIIELEELD